MPSWILSGVRNADPLLVLALVMLIAIVVADVLNRVTRLPRITGLMLVGALASPLITQLVRPVDVDRWKPLLDLAIGALVFELGSRIRPRWLVDNRWLAVSCVLEGVLAGAAVTIALGAMGVPTRSAFVAGAVAMSTSPVIVMAMVHELRPRGQVVERMLLMTALNSVLAMLVLRAWRVIGAVGWPSPGDEWFGAGMAAISIIGGSLLLGAATGGLLHLLTRRNPNTSTMPVLQITLVILATTLAATWKFSPLLTLLTAGVMARAAMGHRLNVEPNLGSAGAVLTVLLFISLGLLSTFSDIVSLAPLVFVIIVARLAGKALAVMATASASGLGWRQGMALTLALQPMSSLVVLIAADTLAWPSQLPGAEAPMLQALLIAVTIMQIAGPLLTRLALREVAQETQALPTPHGASPATAPPPPPVAAVGTPVHDKAPT